MRHVPAMANHDEDLSLASRLCLACGLCCDGTVYEQAAVRPEDIAPANACGFRLFKTEQDRQVFLFPCHYLEDSACTRYDQWRPSVCGSFFCLMQKRVAEGECSEAEGFSLIERAKSLRSAVLALLKPGQHFLWARSRFDALAGAKADLAPADAQLVVRMFVLERFLDQHFRKPGKKRLPGGAIARPAVEAAPDDTKAA
ncbi:hypothetical protein Saro_2311 [Novosphingobium aromaticivorans DSM 12444]|uniref:YkgJ family cysteine cluster protein n=2 Tax=Novosphingobium aromaticivorans TaxID=48935 RepID=Q2G5X5_NOVAD|nr:hypothetical protein Saro_2311 [Novosphingobium aromaticivorans DSM 12444]